MTLYLDHQATTPCDARVVAAMLPYFSENFGNPHSAEHGFGQKAADAVETARAQVAALIGAEPREIIFTSGATEANNLAIKGVARFAGSAARPRIITFAAEHKCVLESMRDLARENFDVAVLGVGADGQPDLAALDVALATPTLLVSAMAANNETGILTDLAPVAAAAARAGALLHSDLAQAAGKIPIDVKALGLALGSISAHKLYGPKGVGALYVRHRPRTRLAPLFSGGGQERGLRPGTLPVPLIVGFGEACHIARENLAAEMARLTMLREELWRLLARAVPGLTQIATDAPRVPGALSLRLPGVPALKLIAACPDLAFSTGSACTSAEIAPSHVLTAIGFLAEDAACCLRLCVGRSTSPGDIAAAAAMIAGGWQRLTSVC